MFETYIKCHHCGVENKLIFMGGKDREKDWLVNCHSCFSIFAWARFSPPVEKLRLVSNWHPFVPFSSIETLTSMVEVERYVVPGYVTVERLS